VTRHAAVVFDFDGTLADTEPIALAIWEELLARRGYVAAPEDWTLMVGQTFPAFHEYFSQRVTLPASEELWAEFSGELFAAFREGLEPFPDAAETVDTLAARSVPLAVASSSPRERLDLAMQLTGFTGRFDTTVAGDEIAAGKPAPDIFEAAAAALGFAAAACVAVEDSVPGVQSAAAAGMYVVAVARGSRTPDDLVAADAIVDRLTAGVLMELIDAEMPVEGSPPG